MELLLRNEPVLFQDADYSATYFCCEGAFDLDVSAPWLQSCLRYGLTRSHWVLLDSSPSLLHCATKSCARIVQATTPHPSHTKWIHKLLRYTVWIMRPMSVNEVIER